MYNAIKKAFTFSVVATTIMWSVGIAALIPSVAHGATCPTLAAGDMIKVPGTPAIYAINNDLKVLYFPSGDEFKSWRPSYGGYISITAECFDTLATPATYPGAVNFHPGSYVVKNVSSDQLYVVEPGNTLAKITPEMATALYGADYKVMTVGPAFWPHYINRGSDVTTAIAHPGMLARVDGVIYYIDASSNTRVVSATGMVANGFQERFVRDLPASAIAGLTAGDAIDAEIVALTDKTQSGGVTGGAISPGTNMTVSLASDNPASANLPAGATNVEMLKFVVSGSGDIDEVIVKRGGVGETTDFANVYIYNGDTRLTSGRSIASDTNTVTFANLKVTAPATLTVVADIATAPGSNTNNFSVTSVNSDGVNVAGNYFTINSSVDASLVTLEEYGGTWEVVLGTTQAEVAKFKITAGVNDVTINRLTLRNGGALANSNLENFKLYAGSTNIASAASMDGDKLVINFATPYSIAKAQTKNLVLNADIVGGRTTDNVKFYVDEVSDIYAIDTTYGVGARVSNLYAFGNQTVSITGGQITLANNGPAATTYSVNTTNNDLFKMSLSSERNITVKKVKIMINTSTGFVASNDTSKIKNIKLVDLSSGTTLVGPITDLDSMTAVAGGYEKEMSYAFDVNAGDTRQLAIQADFDTSLTDGSVISATLDLNVANYVYDNDASEYVAITKIVPSTITGNSITGSSSSLTVTKTATPSDTATVRGTEKVDALGFNFAAGTADNLKVNKIVLRIYGDDDGTWATATGDTAANLIASTISLWDGSTQVGVLKGLTLVDTNSDGDWDAGEYYKAEFTNLNFVVDAGNQKKLVAKVDLMNTITAERWLAVDLDQSDLEVENSAGNLLTGLTGKLNHATGTSNTAIDSKMNGTLAISVDGETPDADVVVTGAQNVAYTKYKLRSTYESFTVVGAAIMNNSSSYDADMVKVVVGYKDAEGNDATKDGYLSAGVLTFADGQLSIPVPVNVDTYVTIKANMNNDADGAVVDHAVKLGFVKASSSVQWTTSTSTNNDLANSFIVMGDSSNSKLYGDTDGLTVDHTDINTQTVRKTNVTVANNMADGTSSQQSQDNVGIFALTSASEAGSNQKSTLNTVTVQLSGSLIASTTGSVLVNLYNGSTYDSAHLMGTTTMSTNAGSTDATVVSTTNNNEFEGTINVHVVVDTNESEFTGTAGSTKTLGAIVSTYAWGDGNDDSVGDATPVTGIPVSGGNLQYSL